MNPTDLIGATIVEASDLYALAFIVEKDGVRYGITVEGYDSDLSIKEIST